MQAQQAELLLRALGNPGAVVPEGTGPWITAPCPLYPFTHGKGKAHQSTPSFGLNLEHDSYNCYVCGGGKLSKLFQLLLFHLGEKPEYAPRYDLQTANLIITGSAGEIAGLPQFTEFPAQAIFQPWPATEYHRFTPVEQVPRAIDYLTGRGCPPAAWTLSGFRYDYARDMIVTPYYTADGVLAGLRGRAVDPNTPEAYRHHDYQHKGYKNTALVWCGESALTTGRPVLVVEGQFDRAQCLLHWDNTMGNLTAHIPERKLRKLLQAPCTVFMMDNDAAGLTGMKDAMDRLRALDPQYPMFQLPYPLEHKDPDTFAVKDPDTFAACLGALCQIEVE